MQNSVHLSYILGDLPLAERFVVARKLGFNGVEYPFPYHVPAREYVRHLRDNGLRQISIGAPACDYKRGEPGFSLTPEKKSEFDNSIDTVIDYAKEIGCKQVHVFAGPKAPDVSDELAFETYCDRIAQAHDRLQVEGLGVVIEAINATDFPRYFINRLDVVVRAMDRIDRPAVKIIMDVYHAQVNSEDPIEFLRQHVEKVAHIQLADFPGRHEPGTGSIDFQRLFDTLRAVDYAGSIGLEYVPTRSIMAGIPLARELNIPLASRYSLGQADVR